MNPQQTKKEKHFRMDSHCSDFLAKGNRPTPDYQGAKHLGALFNRKHIMLLPHPLDREEARSLENQDCFIQERTSLLAKLRQRRTWNGHVSEWWLKVCSYKGDILAHEQLWPALMHWSFILLDLSFSKGECSSYGAEKTKTKPMFTARDPLCFRENVAPDHTPDLALASWSLCRFSKISDLIMVKCRRNMLTLCSL